MKLLPLKGQFVTGDEVLVEVDGAGVLELTHLGDVVAAIDVAAGDSVVSLGALPTGGYAVRLRGDGATAATAVAVVDDPRRRMRYGFVASYRPDRSAADVAAIADLVRRLHLTAVQFYDWAYRHADLVGGGDDYRDALDQPVSLATVRRLVTAVQSTGAAAIGYAAVYGVGNDEWDDWHHDALLDGDGAPYSLGNFLQLVDPAAGDWLDHLATDLAASVEQVGFDGFHLDQYGYPRVARRADGTVVDLAESFITMIAAARRRLPNARLVFNNVNDFPTWATAPTDQDAVYVEVWTPHDTLADLATVVTRARTVAAGKPVVLAAYQSVFRHEHDADNGAAAAERATQLTMATLFSHGATQLLAGETGNVLVDPYYVHNHPAEPATLAMLQRWYDFLVAHDELLVDSGIVDVTGSWSGPLNDLIDVAYTHTPVTFTATAGSVWQRVTRAGDRLVVHLINLAGQDDIRWDAPRQPFADLGAATLRVRGVGPHLPEIRVADPDGTGVLEPFAVRGEGLFVVAELPPLHAWQLITIDLVAAS